MEMLVNNGLNVKGGDREKTLSPNVGGERNDPKTRCVTVGC